MAGTIKGQHAEHGAIQPVPYQPPPSQQRRINLPHNADYLLTYHPARWDYMDGRWLPVLGKLHMDPGVGGVDKDRDTALAESIKAKEGWRILPAETYPGGYVRQYLAKSGGMVHMSPWETPKQVGNRVIVTCDEGAYRDWLGELLDQRHIPAPDPDVIDAIIESHQQRVIRMQEKASTPGLAEKAKKAEAKLKAMQKARDKLFASAE